MAKSNKELISALKQTAENLANGKRYEWGHMGRCNAGHLVQTVTSMSDREIVKSIDFQLNEWSELAKDYCDADGHKVDDLFLTLKEIGFGHDDVVKLEYLSDSNVLSRLPQEKRKLKRNNREDVVTYMNEMADMLEEELV